MKIACILPRGMSFSAKNASSIDLIVRDQVLNSRFGKSSTVIGPSIQDPFEGISYRGVAGRSQKQLNSGYLDCLKSLNPDLAIVHQYPKTAGFLAENMPNTPVVLYRHGLLRARSGMLSRRLKSNQFKNLKGIVFVSSFLKSKFLNDFPRFEDKCRVLNNAVDTEFWRPAYSKDNSICFAGRARKDKGILELIHGFSMLQGCNWQLNLILAATNPEEGKFLDRIKKLVHSAERINLHVNMQHNEVRDAFARAKIAALPSIVSEGFPRSVVEALASGCTTITTRNGGTPEAAGPMAVYLDSVSDDSIVNTLYSLISKPEYLKSSSAESREYAVENLDIKAQIVRFDELMENFAGKRS